MCHVDVGMTGATVNDVLTVAASTHGLDAGAVVAVVRVGVSYRELISGMPVISFVGPIQS